MTKKEQKKLATIPSSAEVSSFTAEQSREDEGLVEQLDALAIRKATDLDFAAGLLREIAARHDALDGKRRSWVDPLNRVVKDINATFKPLLDALKRAEATVKEKIGKFHVEAERERSKMLAEAGRASESNPAKAERLIERAELLDVPKVDGVGVKMVWTGEVVDASLIPREFLSPDVKKLLAVTEAGGSDPKIPGWRAWETAQVRTRRSS
jgi:hypothetical protein